MISLFSQAVMGCEACGGEGADDGREEGMVDITFVGSYPSLLPVYISIPLINLLSLCQPILFYWLIFRDLWIYNRIKICIRSFLMIWKEKLRWLYFILYKLWTNPQKSVWHHAIDGWETSLAHDLALLNQPKPCGLLHAATNPRLVGR